VEHVREALKEAEHHLRRSGLKLVGYLVLAYLVLKLVPSLKQALHSLEHVSWEWVVGALALEVLSETGFVIAWRAIVDPDRVLEADGRGRGIDQRVAWTQLGGGLLLPGGSFGGMGVGSWILHRFGMDTKTIAERQLHHRRARGIDPASRQPGHGWWDGRDADRLRRRAQRRGRRCSAAPVHRPARAVHRRRDLLRDPPPPLRVAAAARGGDGGARRPLGGERLRGGRT
jgi:hypothetical protein